MSRTYFRVLVALAAALFLIAAPALAQAPTPAPGSQPDSSVGAPGNSGVVPNIAPVPTPEAPPTEEAPSVPSNAFFYVQGDRLVKVEETPIETGTSVDAGGIAGAALGFGGPKSWMVLAGATSELQIAESQPRFRLACERSAALQLRLGVFEVKGEKRRAQVDLGKLIDVFKKKAEITVTKVSDGVYEFTPKKPLKPGEYAFAAGYGNPVADFTITAPEGKDGEKKN